MPNRMSATVTQTRLMTNQRLAGTKPVAVWAVLGCQDDPRASGGAHQIADSGHDPSVGAAIQPAITSSLR
jgi:hypothetical protein